MEHPKKRTIFQHLKAAVRGEEMDLTSGSIRKAIFMLSVPMVLEMVLESVFAVVDVFFVGRVSVNAQATVGLTEAVVMIVYSIAVGLSMAVTAMVARRIGEKDEKGAGEAAFQGLIIGGVLAIAIGVLGAWFAEDILRLMGGSEELISEGKGYTQIMFAGNITIMYIFLINAIFRGAGDAAIAMRALWLANGINIVLDPIFIFGWGPIPALGVEGAAIATTIGRGIGVLYQLYVLSGSSSRIKITKQQITIEPATILRLMKVSLGGMGQYLIGSASWMFMARTIALFGPAAVAGYTVAFRLIIFSVLPSWGMANAAATLVGQNLGAGKPDRAEISVWRCGKYNMIFLASLAVIYWIAAPIVVPWFNSDPEVIKYGVAGLRIICSGYVFFAYGMVINQSFNGAGDTKTPTMISFISFWIIQIPLAYTLAMTMGWGPEGVYWAIAIAESLLAVISIWLFRKGRWKKVEI